MVKETHTKGGYLFALLMLPVIDNRYLSSYESIYRLILLIIYILFSYIGSLIPDIDMRGSYASKTCPMIYKFFGSKFRHRGITHSLIFVYLLCNLFNAIVKCSENNIVFICSFSGFIVGYVSHLCLDLLTKEGIELFYPISINFSILPIKTSSKSEKIFCKVLNFIFIFLLGYRFYILL